MSDTSELNVALATGVEVNVKGEAIKIAPLKLGQLPVIFEKMKTVTAILMNNELTPEALTEMLSSGSTEVFDLMSLVLKKDREWIDDLDLDDGVALLTAILEVNLDFFVRKVLPLITKKAEVLKEMSGQK